MQKPKTLKPKETQQSILSTVLAEFDIQTQVNKMVMRQFDTLMRTNKQAFDFIKESEHKFIKFQQRLSKAETYYQNIQLNINSKVQLTDNMNKRLEQFSVEFWQGMKENNNELIAMNKRYDQLAMEKRGLENRVGEVEKNVRKLEAGQFNLNEKINGEISKVYEVVRDTDSRVGIKFAQQKQQLQQLSTNIIQSRSLLQSKSSLLTSLMQDLQLYKSDRPQIKNQLQKIFQQLQHRAFKLELIEMRGYVDSKIVEESERANGLCMRLETQIKLEERDRKREAGKVLELVRENQLEAQKNLRQVEKVAKEQTQQLKSELSQARSAIQSTIQTLSVQISTLNTSYQKQIPQLFSKSSQLKLTVDSLTKSTQANSNQIKQAFSNIDSINQLIGRIIDQNNQRKEEMRNLKSSTENKGDIQQQVRALGEALTVRLIEAEKCIEKLENETLERIVEKVYSNHQLFVQNSKQMSSLIEQLNTKLLQSQKHHSNQLTKITTSLTTIITQTSNTLSSQLQTLQLSTHSLIQQKLTSIQKQLNQLDRIQQEIKQFKEVFRKQFEETQKVNASVAEKMERVMGLFTKLKSDNSVKFQQVNGELQKKTVEIKGSLNDLDAIKKYLSLSNECITILLASSSLSSTTIPKQPSLNHSLTTLPQQQKIQPTSKPIKLTSMLQGWILQTDQTLQKIKYRGENFTPSQRYKLVQLFLEYFTKQTEKIKGSILENGKDVFVKVLESGEDMFQQRKKATSKRKPSQLPKLYM